MKINEKEKKYAGGILAIIILLVIGAYLIFGSSEYSAVNVTVGVGLLALAGFIGYLIKRTT